MIRELSELGKKLRNQKSENAWVHDALKEEPVSISLIIHSDGKFDSFTVFEKRVTTVEAITAKKGKARLLLDKAEEVLGYGGEKSKRKHQLFMEKLEQYKNLEALKPVWAFYNHNKNSGIDKAINEFEIEISDEKDRKGNISFLVRDKSKFVHEEAEVYGAIIEKYERDQEAHLAASEKKCSVCGSKDYPVVDLPHGMIKRVPDGQMSGCALISYNENAFESYALKGNNNSAICTNCAKTYVEGFNWLLSNGSMVRISDKRGKEKEVFRPTNRRNFGSDTAMVFWTRENADVKELGLLDEPKPDDIAGLIKSVSTGEKRTVDYIETDQFYSCTLSGAAARIAVRDWIQTSLFDFRKNIAQWFSDIAIDYSDYDLRKTITYHSRLYELARCCQNVNGDNDVTLSRTAGYLWNAAVKNSSPPWWMLTAVLKRAQIEERGVTRERAALIKLILNRRQREGGFMVQNKLAKNGKPAAYICGQLFAALESIQREALGKEINAGIRERYFTFAMTTPSSAFGRLFNLSSKHFTKLKGEKPGLAVVLDKELQDLCKDIKIEEFPAAFTLEEQGQFAIGYYHQKQARFSRVELEETVEEK